jgi:hypothetical protein
MECFPTAMVKRIQFSTVIAAPVKTVYEKMIDAKSYTDWTAAFSEGSYYTGSWQPGEKIRFLSPSGEGMISEIAENRINEFISIRHLGCISKGMEDTQSEAIKTWSPSYENYTFQPTDEGTKLIIGQDATPEFESYLVKAWPKALARLKALCESCGTA